MKWAIFLLFTAFLCLTLWLWQVDNHLSATAYQRLKNALDVATHDAALQIDREKREKTGDIVFAPSAHTVLLDSLRRNLNLDADGRPLQPNLFRSANPVEVLVFDEVESGCPGASPGFPCTYDNPDYGYTDTLTGPAIVTIIRVRHPRPFPFSPDTSYVVGGAHEYKGY